MIIAFASAWAAFVIGSATECFAAKVSDYRDRVHRSAMLAESLILDEEGRAITPDPARLRDQFIEIRRLLPKTERIETEDGVVEADNVWLHIEAERIELLSVSDPERVVSLRRIAERLNALRDRMIELDGLKTVEKRSKEDAKTKLASILRRSEYAKEPQAPGIVGRVLQRFWKWLREFLPERNPMSPGTFGRLSSIAQYAILALAFAIIVYVVLRFLPRFLRDRRLSMKLGKSEARVVLGERVAADKSSADLLAEAEALAREHDRRGAIRKAYIALLCELGDRKIVSLAQHKTNRDYLRAVRDRSQLHSSMRDLTSSFENHWYGFQPAEETDWDEFRSRYHRALQGL